jgi:hypothetical protein
MKFPLSSHFSSRSSIIGRPDWHARTSSACGLQHCYWHAPLVCAASNIAAGTRSIPTGIRVRHLASFWRTE